ncbi:dicarboxylate/amino acid:cation symporter [Oceanicaulis sp. LC35]|uniref:dicarboxylate/amino acid:cation symporter n=1 Tax=Oceanicaulis sp. LC35 TaxID=3349635 RepID=UPI003F856455
MRGWFKIALWQRVLGALVVGVIFGAVLSNVFTHLNWSVTNESGEVLVAYTSEQLPTLIIDGDGEPLSVNDGPPWVDGNGANYPEATVYPLTGSKAAAYRIQQSIGWVGKSFIQLIKMLIVPLILTTLISGVVAMGDPKKLGSIGLKTFALYFGTTFFANIIGIIFGLVFRPGEGMAETFNPTNAVPPSTDAPSIAERLVAIIPENPVAALADGDVLAIIFFAVLLGVGILMAGRDGKLVGDFFTQAANVVLKVTHLVMEVAPFGVFALISFTVAMQGLEALAAIAVLIVAVYLGLLTHAVVVYGVFIRFVLGLPVMNFLRGMLDAIAVAYSTASSSATLPVTIANATENLGVKRSIAGSVLPLGATINMDGTALYLGILALFTAQAFGYDLTLANYFLIAFTAAIVSIGAAGIPSASLFLLAIVLNTFDVSPEHVAIIVGVILPVDRIMDMARTALNVTGDATVATAVAKWEGELDEDCYRHPADQPYEPKTTPDVADADRD